MLPIPVPYLNIKFQIMFLNIFATVTGTSVTQILALTLVRSFVGVYIAIRLLTNYFTRYFQDLLLLVLLNQYYRFPHLFLLPLLAIIFSLFFYASFYNRLGIGWKIFVQSWCWLINPSYSAHKTYFKLVSFFWSNCLIVLSSLSNCITCLICSCGIILTVGNSSSLFK